MKKYHIEISDDEGREIVSEWLTTVFAIAKLQEVITMLRRPTLPQHDHSYGEAPMPILAPGPEELKEFINHAVKPLQ